MNIKSQKKTKPKRKIRDRRGKEQKWWRKLGKKTNRTEKENKREQRRIY